MATITKSAPTINPSDPASDLKMIEDRYTGYTSEAMAGEIARRQEKLSKLEPGTDDYRDLAAELEDFQCVHSMAETNEALFSMCKRLLMAYELKQDHDFVVRELEAALVDASIPAPVDAPFGSVNFDKPEVTLPDEVCIEVTGDNLPVKVLADGATLTLKSNVDGIATYSVSMS